MLTRAFTSERHYSVLAESIPSGSIQIPPAPKTPYFRLVDACTNKMEFGPNGSTTKPAKSSQSK